MGVYIASNLEKIGQLTPESPVRHEAIIWTNAGIMLIGSLGINFGDIWIKIYYFLLKESAFENVVCEMGTFQCLNVLIFQ